MKKLFAIIFFFLGSGLMLAQKDLGFELDYARFNYDSTSVYLEFYYDLNPKNMTVTQTPQGSTVDATVHFELKNIETGQFFINKNWKLTNTINSLQTDSTSKSFIGALGFDIA